MANIQQSINQLLGQATIATGLWAHSPAGQDFAKRKSLERRADRLASTITGSFEKEITELSDEEYAELEQQVEDFTNIQSEYMAVAKTDEEAQDLTRQKANILSEMKKRATERKQKKAEEAQKKEEEAQKKAEDERATKYASDVVNQAQRELRQDWRADALQQLQTRDQFQDFLDNLESQMWYNN